jgi:hypothetical protein
MVNCSSYRQGVPRLIKSRQFQQSQFQSDRCKLAPWQGDRQIEALFALGSRERGTRSPRL